jgi:uncharacterized protein
MRKDELNLPLKRRGMFERVWAKRPTLLQMSSVLAGLAFAGGIGWLVNTPYPFGGEPVLVLAIPPAEIMTASTDEAAAPPAEQAEAEPLADAGSDPKLPADAIIVEPEEQRVADTGARIIVSTKRSLAAAPIETVAEEGPYGVLPKVGRGNKKPSDVYARSTSRGVTLSDSPKIVIVLGGMGLNEELTRRAIKDLPGEITLGFAPYGENLQPQVNKARAGGHEVLLQVPMEPFGYPATNPGPKTLLSTNDANANLDALMWHMGRFAGYTGLMNYMGGKFLSEPAALKPVFSELRKRGLVYLGDGTVARSLSVEMGKMTGLPVRDAALVIDANPTPDSIARRLDELEEIAKRDGIAVATGSGLEITIDAVRDWTRTLNERGIVLLPASSAFKGPQG